MPIIYSFDLNTADFSYGSAPAYWSSTWGGSDTPNADYPEFGQLENIHRVENGGASGQHVADAIDQNNYTISWITLCGVGNLANGQFDCRGGGAGQPLKFSWQQFLKASAIQEAGVSVPLILANGGAGGTGSGLFSTNLFLRVRMNQTTGANFDWDASYRTPTGGGGFTLAHVNGSADTSDDAEHSMIVTIVPSTITGAFTGDGSQGSGVVDSDGSFSVSIDGVTVVSASGIQFVINPFANSNPEVYYGKTVWFGD